MNVVMLGPFGLHPKGTMRARALPAARALARRGHEITLIMPPWHTPAEAGRCWEEADAGVRLEYVSLDGLDRPLVGHGLVAARMARRALALRPDVVHAFKPKAYSGLAAALLGLWQRRDPTVGPLLMDTDDWEGPGGWNDLEPYSANQRRVFAWQERWGLVHADAVTVASRALETLAWSLGVPRERVTYLPNAVEVAADEAEVDAGSAPPPVGAIATDAPPTLLLYTRFFEFDLARPLEVLARVRRSRPDTRLIVVGRGLFKEEMGFVELTRQLELDHAVDYRGWVEPEDLPAVMAEADVALYPFDDTLVNRTKSSVKLLELMAAGVPVVAEAVGQNREVIEDGRSGRLVPPGDVGAFARAVAELLADPRRRRTMGAAARERIRDDFSWDRQVEILEQLYFDAQDASRRVAR